MNPRKTFQSLQAAKQRQFYRRYAAFDSEIAVLPVADATGYKLSPHCGFMNYSSMTGATGFVI